jgi:hypothetical protein
MPNTKPIGVAYSDPLLDSVTVTGTSTLAAVTATTVAAASVAATGAVSGATLTSAADAAASNAVAGVYFYTTAITGNSTATTAPKGSLGGTSNATGAGKLFVSDGSKWQLGAIT